MTPFERDVLFLLTSSPYLDAWAEALERVRSHLGINPRSLDGWTEAVTRAIAGLGVPSSYLNGDPRPQDGLQERRPLPPDPLV